MNFCSVLTMLWGTSSRFVQVTVEPTATAAITGAAVATGAAAQDSVLESLIEQNQSGDFGEGFDAASRTVHMPKSSLPTLSPATVQTTERAIPAYEADGSTFRVLFGFGAEGLGRIQLTALKPSAAACEDLEKRLTDENGKPSSRGETGGSLPGQEIVWTTPAARIALACAEKASLNFRTVALDYTPPGP